MFSLNTMVRMLFRVDVHVLTNFPQGEAPVSDEIRGSAAESAKSFIAGGFGGVCAVLVGSSTHNTSLQMVITNTGRASV